jgi:phosphate transport system substrate-binding protein
MTPLRFAFPALLAGLLLTLCGCPKPASDATIPAGEQSSSARPPSSDQYASLSGKVDMDGSSTVYPIMEAAAEEFGKAAPGVRVTVGVSGTGGGFKRFCAGETDISNASRPISLKELDLAKQNSLEFIEVPMAYDGLSVVVNPKNDWCSELTVAELKKIWGAGSKITNWKDVRAGFPDRPLKLYGPGADSGTFDYFTEAINGKSKESRSDYTASEDDNVLVQGVAGDVGGLGYFGFAYFEENQDKLKLVGIKTDEAAAAVLPSAQTIQDLTYQPLSRPLLFYVSDAAADRPEVAGFIDYFLENAVALVDDAGYIALPDDVYLQVTEHWEAGRTGSGFKGEGAKPGTKVEDILNSLAGESSPATTPAS